MKSLYLLVIAILLLSKSYAQTSYTWNGSTSTNWSVSTNWTPVGVPLPIDNVTIVTGANNCILTTSATISNLTITSGLLNLNGLTLTTTSVVACNSGSCTNGSFNSTASSLTFAGTLMNVNITATAADIYFNGSVFNGSVTVTKTGAVNNSSTGNNIFNNFTSITNSGLGHIYLTNGGVGRIDNFNGNTILNVTNSGYLYVGYARDANINNAIKVNNTSSSSIVFLGVNNSNINLIGTAAISCGTFTGGSLRLYKLLQTSSTSQTLSPGSLGIVEIYNSSFTNSLTINAGIITAQTSTFAATTTYSVSGTILNNWSSGGNYYNGRLNVYNSSNGYLGFANGTADVYNGDVYAYNTSTTGGRIIFSNNCNSSFNGNIYVSQTGVTNASGIAIGWGGTYPVVTLASGKNIFVNGVFDSGYLQLKQIQTSAATSISLTTTGTSNVQLEQNTFNGSVFVNTPDIYPRGGTYNAPTTFIKTGGNTGNHNGGNLNIFNSTLDLQNQSVNYILLGYQSADQFNGNITVSSTNTGGIYFGWFGDIGTPILASGRSITVGSNGFSAGTLHFGSFTQVGTLTPVSLTLTGTAGFEVYRNTIPSTFNSSVTIMAPDITLRGGTFNSTAEFTKTGGTSNHNNGAQNIFNSTCTINQQSTSGYFMLGYNSNDLFNGNIVVTNTGAQDINFGWTVGTGTPTQATAKTITVGSAGFNGGSLNFYTFTQLGTSPINLNFTGTTTLLRFARNSVFNGNITSVTPRVFFDGATFNGVLNATKTGANSDASAGGNVFNNTSTFINNGSGYLLFGNGTPDTWNADVTFSNNGSERILPCYNSVGNIFNANINLNSSGSATGIVFCDISTSTATMTAGYSINTGTYDAGYLILQRFIQLGTTATNLTLSTNSNYLQFGPSSSLGGNVTSASPNLYLNGCNFNGTTDLTKTAGSGNYGQGGNVFNGLSKITNNGNSYLLLGNTNPDIWNNDVIFTNTSNERLLPCWATVGNLFNGNIYVNTGGSAQGIQFCGGNSTATATLAATKSVFTGTLGLNAGYLQLKQFTQLGNAPISLTMSPTATYIQYGPSSLLGGNVTSVSPGLYFQGCTFNGTTNCTKNGVTNDNSSGNNIFNGATDITNSGSGYLLFGNGNADQFNGNATFNNTGSAQLYVAYNSSNNIFGGITTFNNSPLTNNLIYVSPYSTGTVFNNNIIVTSTFGQGVQFCTSNGSASATLIAGKTISIGGVGFSSGTLLLKQFTQVGATPQVLNLTGSGNLTFGPTSYFGGNVNCSSPTLFFNTTNFNSTLNATKTGTTSDASPGGNIFNGVTTMTNNGDGYLLLGNTNFDLFNAPTTFNNFGTNRFYFAHNHGGQTTTFNSDLTINSNKSGGTDAWSYFACEGSNTNMLVNGNFILNNSGAIQSYCRFLQGAATTATYNGNVTINLTNTFNNTQIQLGNIGTSWYNGNISVNNTSSLNNGGVYFNGGIVASSTLAATKTISLGLGGFAAGELSLLRFTQVSAMPQTLLQTTGTGRLILGPTSSFDGNVNFNFPQVLLNGTIYNGTAIIEKNGATDNSGNGGNIFNNTTTVTNSGSGFLMTGNVNSDAFNAPTTFNNTGSYRIYFAHNHTGQTTTFTSSLTLNSNKTSGTDAWSYFIGEGTSTNVTFGGSVIYNVLGTIQSNCRLLNGVSSNAIYNNDLIFNISNSNTSTQIQHAVNGLTTYNGNISVTNTGGANGIYFNLNASATSTMLASKSMSMGITGFNAGTLDLVRFTQLGSATNNLSFTGTSRINYGPTSLFGGNINSTSGALYFNTSTFNGTVTCTKNGTTNDASGGGNFFNAPLILTNNGVGGYLLMANTTSDAYNGNVSFIQNNTGIVYPNYNTNCTYAGNINVGSTGSYSITFGSNTNGIATIMGNIPQIISKTGTAGNPNFTRLIVNKTADSVRLNTRVNITNTLSLVQGIVHTNSVNVLNMNNNSLTNIGNAQSFINGPMNYDKATSGATTLNLPIGKIGSVLSGTAIVTTYDWRPAMLTANHNNTTSYTYNSEVFVKSADALAWAMPPTVTNVSRIHWWDIVRQNTSTGVVTPTLNLSGNQTITLFYGLNDGVTDPINLTVVKNTYNATNAWKDIGGTGATLTTGSVTSSSAPTVFNSFSRFTLGNRVGGSNPLPIELLSFNATPSNRKIDLDWKTASEKNNSHFEIERSKDGFAFEYVTTVNAYGNGNSSVKQDYQTIDEKPYSGLSYYRLKQIDIDKQFTYSSIIAVNLDSQFSFVIYPNPANTEITIKTSSIENGANVKIINSFGAVVKTISFENIQKGSVNISDLAQGIYYLQLDTNTTKETIKLSIVR